MQSNQTDTLFIKDLFLKTKSLLTLCKRYLESIREQNKYLNEDYHISNYLSLNVDIEIKERTKLKFDFLDKEKIYNELKEYSKNCYTKEVIEIELGMILLNLEPNKLDSIYNLFKSQFDKILDSLNELDKDWNKLFDSNFNDDSYLISIELHDNLLVVYTLITYLEDILLTIKHKFLNPLARNQRSVQENKENVTDFIEEESLENSRTLNSILILLDKIGFFNLPQVENLGENKKGELIAFLTKYKESTCKVTIKEMSESPSAEGRNNPYKVKKAKKDANDFLTKLNS